MNKISLTDLGRELNEVWDEVVNNGKAYIVTNQKGVPVMHVSALKKGENSRRRRMTCSAIRTSIRQFHHSVEAEGAIKVTRDSKTLDVGMVFEPL